MNTEYIIENLRFEILKPYHNLSRFKSNSRKLNKYLKKQALKEQKDNNKVTHLVICNAELIAYFSLEVHFEGMPVDDYDEIIKAIPDIPNIKNIPLVEIKRFAIDKKYETYNLAGVIFDNIIYNIKDIFKDHTDFDGVSICVGDECRFPTNERCSENDDENELKEGIHKGNNDNEFYYVKRVN